MSNSNIYEQPSLEYYGTTGYVPDSDTSIVHADYERKRADSVQRTIWNAIHQAGSDGATCQEVEAATDIAHQTVSASIRNMELDGYEKDVSRGKLVKLTTIRDGGHAYVSSRNLPLVPVTRVMEPNKRRVSYKAKIHELLNEIESVIDWPQEFLSNHLRGLIESTRAELDQ